MTGGWSTAPQRTWKHVPNNPNYPIQNTDNIEHTFPQTLLFFSPPSQGILIAFPPNPWGQGQWKEKYGKLD